MKAPEYTYQIPYPLARSSKEELIAGLPFALLAVIRQSGDHVEGFRRRSRLACGLLVACTLGRLELGLPSIWSFHMIKEVRDADEVPDASAAVCFECGLALRESNEYWTNEARGRAMAAAVFAYVAGISIQRFSGIAVTLGELGCGVEDNR